MEKNEKFTVLVTGFGPFGKHFVNASWEAVKELNKLFVTSKEMLDVEMIVKEIPVSYEHVYDYVPKLWEEYKPTVVLHTGVSHRAQCLTIEQYAHSCGYERTDICKKCPKEGEVESKILETELDVKKICDVINENSDKSNCTACISHDAGRYLCEYIFYKSLTIAPDRTLFVHVPDLDKYSSEQTAKGLYEILRCMIEAVRKGCQNLS